MALVTGNVIGNLSGKLGNLSARTVNGQTILAARPSSFNASQEPASLEVRSKFAVTVNFAKNVLSFPALVDIWKKSKEANHSVFNAIFKANFAFAATEKPTANNIITPGGFNLPVTNVTVGADEVTATITALNAETELAASEVDASIVALVVYSNPNNPEDEPAKIITFSKEVSAYNFTGSYNLTFVLSNLQQNISSKYQDSILLLALVTKEASGKIVQYSSTYSKTSA